MHSPICSLTHTLSRFPLHAKLDNQEDDVSAFVMRELATCGLARPPVFATTWATKKPCKPVLPLR
eukprot:m.200926 g.200926  ORF g.200926 m.200926 type:complete len:65 (+) comp15500_c1_seq16:175-369(+)